MSPVGTARESAVRRVAKRLLHASPAGVQRRVRRARIAVDRRSNPYRALERTVVVPGDGPVVVLDLVGRGWDELEREVAARAGRTERLVAVTDAADLHRARGVACVVEYVPATPAGHVTARLGELARLYAADAMESPRLELSQVAPRASASGTVPRVSVKRLLPAAAAVVLALAVCLVLSAVYGWGDALTAALAIALVVVVGAGAAVVLRKVVGLLVSIQRYARLSSERTAALRPSVSKLSASVQEYARISRSRTSGGARSSTLGLATGAKLVLALGDTADDPDLERFAAASPRGEVLIVTDRDDLVPRLARTLSVEYVPTVGLSPGDAVARVTSRLVEIAVECSSEAIVVWPARDAAVRTGVADVDHLVVLGGAPLRALLQVDADVRDRLDHQHRLVEAVDRFAEQVGVTEGTRLDDVAKQLAALQKSVERLDRTSDKRTRDSVKEVGRNLDAVYRQFESLVAMYREFDGERTVPHLRGWAVSPDLALDLLERVVDGRARTVVEAGSGTSTVLFAMAMERAGDGHVTALDHDAGYAAQTVALLERYGLSHRATVHHAPLVETEVDGAVYRWYDIGGLDLPHGIDLLFVDGPPEATGPKSRYPALPLLAGHLADRAEIVLDDGRRADETEIVQLWSQRPDVIGHELLKHEREPWLVRFERAGAPAPEPPA